MKSIVIIAKGPSILRSNRKHIDSFDEVAICGRPIFNPKYEKLYGSRAHYDFSNCAYPRHYSAKLMNKLGLKKIYNTGNYSKRVSKKTRDFCPSGEVEYDPKCRTNLKSYFKNKYDLDPSSGSLALEYLLQTKKYNKIGLIGYDLMAVGEDAYYFPKHELQSNVLKFINDGKTFDKKGVRIFKSGHDPDKTFKYMIDIFKNNPHIKFEILSNRKFPKLKNLSII